MSTPPATDDAENTADASRPLRTDELRRAKPDRHTFLTLPRTPLHLVLDGLTSAANVGSIFRLADALRVERLWLAGCSVYLKGSRFRQASKGIAKWVSATVVSRAEDALHILREQGVHVVGVELCAHNKPLVDLRPRFPSAIVVGNESLGVSSAALALYHEVVALPMLGQGNSINVSNALAAVAYWVVAGGVKQ